MSSRFNIQSISTLLSLASIAVAGPCDAYAAGKTPCVAAHSTTRALYDNFSGGLYEVTRASDGATLSINTLYTGGVANSKTQDTFCKGTTCTITTIYDQSGRGNNLTPAPPGGAASGPGPNGYDLPVNATLAPAMLDGHKVYGIYITPGHGYRNDETNGVATGNEPEGIYAVVDGTHYNNGCCFDYGNAERNATDNGASHMEALYFGLGTGFGTGTGNGPWILVDMENGLYSEGADAVNPNEPTVKYRFTSGFIKGARQNLFSIRGGNAQSGGLSTFYSGKRPPGYYPMHKEGAIILGIGGDNSNFAQGTWYEGAMTTGYPTGATERKVQADIVAARYAPA